MADKSKGLPEAGAGLLVVTSPLPRYISLSLSLSYNISRGLREKGRERCLLVGRVGVVLPTGSEGKQLATCHWHRCYPSSSQSSTF